jgi:hypothetical protein
MNWMTPPKTPTFLDGLLKGMKLFGECVSTLVNSILLSVAYLLGVGIPSLLARAFGKRFLDRTVERHAKTYWRKLDLHKEPIEEYYRQF